MSKVLENIEGYLFPEYSKRKLHTLSGTYEALARRYRDIPQQPKGQPRSDILHYHQLAESKLVFARHLEEISQAVDEVADTVMHVSVPTEHKKKALLQHLKKHGILVKEMVFLENDGASRRLSLVARQGLRRELPVEEFAAVLSVYLDKRLVPALDSAALLTRNYDTFIFEEEPHFTILSAMSRAVKEDEKVSGDNYSVEEGPQGSVVLMIADGMGSGEQACEDSRCVIEFMEKFLEAGFQKEKALTMINAAIASQAQCTNLTTLDVCEVNLHRGEAEFLKAGAAVSYRKRGTQVDAIESETLPLGSLSRIMPMTQTIGLMDSDMLILLSDGVADCFEDKNGRNHLKEIIAAHQTSNPKEMSDYLLRYAINCQAGRIRDDMTILTAGIWETNM